MAGRIMRILGFGGAYPEQDEAVDPHRFIWSQRLAVNAAIALVIAAHAANASRAGEATAIPEFYAAVALLFLPIAARLAYPEVARTERIVDLLIATFALFMLRVLREPNFFISHDEYLHWVTAQHIMESGRLFTSNVLFPIGPSYPGLEIVTTAFASLSGLPIFTASVVMLMIARMVFVASLFMVYERVTNSARVAALACLFYMGSSTFVFFDVSFSYASLAMMLMALALYFVVRPPQQGAAWMRGLPFVLCLLALCVTHHMTAYVLGGLIACLFALEAIRGGTPAKRLFELGLMASFAVLAPILWSKIMGNPGAAYLGPVFQNGVKELVSFILSGSLQNRALFTTDDGILAPVWQRYLTLGSVAIICAGLALGFFRSLCWAGLRLAEARDVSMLASFSRARPRWSNSALALLTLLTIFYPFAIMFRLTRSGWEIGNRIGPFAFLGVGVVLAILVASLLQKSSRSVWRAGLIGAAATVILLGGVISSEGPRVLVPALYQVSADEASIEPMGIAAAEWTKQWLGPDHRFATDRINRLLLSGFGGQKTSTTLQHGIDAGVLLALPTLDREALEVIDLLGFDYVLADLRLTTGLPVVGAYFDGGRADQLLGKPPLPASLLKFDTAEGANRVFDNGYSIIYDVRKLSGKP